MRYSLPAFLLLTCVAIPAARGQKPHGVHPPFPKRTTSSVLYVYQEAYAMLIEDHPDSSITARAIQTDSAFIVPIALVNNGKLSTPLYVQSHSNPKRELQDQKAFINAHYGKSNTIALLKDGVPVDTLHGVRSVPDASDDIRLVLQATTDRSTLIPFDPYGTMLAGSPELFNAYAARSSEGSAKDRLAVYSYINAVFAKHGRIYRSIDTFYSPQIVFTPISSNNEQRAIAHILTRPDTNGNVYSLTLILKRTGENFISELTEFTIPDDTAMFLGNYIDRLDLDHDGTDELIFQASAGENQGVAIFKYHNGAWKKIYDYFYGA
jgi:hypothetical protein